ncbi:MAG TPA: hypothetical protein VEL07_21325 [Planctomycetota bacterium]|nr:hypothetical protein [Planctomycetota bacterium]
MTRLVLLLVVAGATFAAEDDGALPPLVGAAPIAPAPYLRPLLPADVDDPRADEDERLQRRLAERVRELDSRAMALIADNGGERPRAVAARGPALEEPRRRRDTAWADFRRALQDRAAHGVRAAPDALDAADPQGQERARTPVASVNQLAIAECYKDLTASAEGTRDDLVQGVRALDAVDVPGLPESELPRLYYLRLWFLAEDARRTPADERAAKTAAARAAAKDLAARFPSSELARTAPTLIIDLDGDGGAAP